MIAGLTNQCPCDFFCTGSSAHREERSSRFIECAENRMCKNVAPSVQQNVIKTGEFSCTTLWIGERRDDPSLERVDLRRKEQRCILALQRDEEISFRRAIGGTSVFKRCNCQSCHLVSYLHGRECIWHE